MVHKAETQHKERKAEMEKECDDLDVKLAEKKHELKDGEMQREKDIQTSVNAKKAEYVREASRLKANKSMMSPPLSCVRVCDEVKLWSVA